MHGHMHGHMYLPGEIGQVNILSGIKTCTNYIKRRSYAIAAAVKETVKCFEMSCELDIALHKNLPKA